MVPEPSFHMAKHAAEVVEKLTTQVEEMKSKIMQIDELKVAHASRQATLEQIQTSRYVPANDAPNANINHFGFH